MSAWESAEAAALAAIMVAPDMNGVIDNPNFVPQDDAGPVEIVPPGALPLIVTDNWDLSMLECPIAGCTISVKPLSKIDAMDLAHRHQAYVSCVNERGATTIERELGIQGPSRPTLGRSTRLIVMVFVSWQDKRWFLLEYVGDR